MSHIYLDYNATTPLKPSVYEAMVPYLKAAYGNPSSIHWAGREAKEGLMIAHEKVASLFRVDPQEVVFVSGGTEANNLALKGIFFKLQNKGRHIITTKVEHKSVLECLEYLKTHGADVTYLSVNFQGGIDFEELKNAIRPDTILVSVQAANNETGVLMPMKEIAALIKERQILFHTDAVQIAGKMPFYLNEIPADLVSLSSHKIYGPKGAGALIIRGGMKLDALIHGGNQERKRRGGTENVPAIVGFGAACHEIKEEDFSDMKRIEKLRNDLEEGIVRKVSGAYVNGLGATRVPNTLNVSFDGLDGEGLLLNLDLKGIAASSGSACSSGLLDPSHVLLAMEVSEELALSSVRFSLGCQTTEEDIETVIRELPEIVSDLRKMNAGCQ